MTIDNVKKKFFLLKKPILTILCATFASGCAVDPKTGQPSLRETFASDDPCSNNARNIGIAAGAILGAVVGNQLQHSNTSRLLGATVGGLAGGLIGHDMDKRRCELSKIAKQYNLDIQVATVSAAGEVIDDARLKNDPNASAIKKAALGSTVEVSDQSLIGGHFETNSDQLTPRAQQYFAAIADSYKMSGSADQIQDPKARAAYIAQYANRKIFLVGHTDDTGSSALNAELSERRAKVVSKFMEDRGIPRGALYYQGAGEFYPIASNETEEGRAKNRRVEIVEVTDAAAFDKFLTSRKPRYEYYRPNDATVSIANSNTKKIDSSSQTTSSQLNANNAKTVASNKNTTGKSAVSLASAGQVATPTSSIQTGSASSKGNKKATAPENNIDFGGVILGNTSVLPDIGKVETKKSLFSLISTAYADEPPVISDCSLDRPRSSNAVKSLSDGKTYRTSEYIPGLYGKTWTDQVNGHQIVMNKVAVLSSDGSLANPPEFKVYKNYNESKSRTVQPDISLKPDVNTYLGSKGVLYRMFINGQAGMQCVDVVFAADGSKVAKAGKLIYAHADKLYMADFKPQMY